MGTRAKILIALAALSILLFVFLPLKRINTAWVKGVVIEVNELDLETDRVTVKVYSDFPKMLSGTVHVVAQRGQFKNNDCIEVLAEVERTFFQHREKILAIYHRQTRQCK